MEKDLTAQKEFVVLKSQHIPGEKKTPIMTNILANSYIVDVYGNEGFSKDLIDVFKSLNEIAFQSGEEMWGNVCFVRKKLTLILLMFSLNKTFLLKVEGEISQELHLTLNQLLKLDLMRVTVQLYG